MVSQTYKNQGQKLLCNTFPSISCEAIKNVLQHVGFGFSNAYALLQEIQNIHNQRNDDDPDSIYFPPEIKRPKKIIIKFPRKKTDVAVTDVVLLQETMVHPMFKNMKNNHPDQIVDNINGGVEEEKVPGVAIIANEVDAGLVECSCCYDDCPPDEMQECTANIGHQACNNCVETYVREQFDGNNSIIFNCIIDEKCNHSYDTNVLTKVVSPRLFGRIEDKRFCDDVEEAGTEMWNCPKCGPVGYLDGTSSSVNCPQCTEDYCTKCDRRWHNNKTCEEVKAEEIRLKDPLLLAHEKMNEATIRRCPNCKIPFVKSDGCNKMICKNCNTISCYLCGIEIPDYSHFCNCNPKKRCSCGRSCKLWTSTPDMDKHDRELRRKAGGIVLEAAGKTEDEIEKLLQTPPKKNNNKKKKNPPVIPQGNNRDGPANAVARGADILRIIQPAVIPPQIFLMEQRPEPVIHQRNVGNGPANPVAPAGNPGNIQRPINPPQNLGMEQRPRPVIHPGNVGNGPANPVAPVGPPRNLEMDQRPGHVIHQRNMAEVLQNQRAQRIVAENPVVRAGTPDDDYYFCCCCL